MMAIMWLIVIGCAIWVYFDAKNGYISKGLTKGFFNMGPAGWALCVLLLWIVAFPFYLVKRDNLKALALGIDPSSIPSHEKPSTVNILSKFIAIGWTVFCAIGAVMGLAAVGETTSNMTNQYELAGAGIGATIGMSIWFMVWLFVTIPATIIFFVTRKNTVVIAQPTAPAAPPPVYAAPQMQTASAADTKKCPFCAETINKEAIFCRHCKKDINQEQNQQKAAEEEKLRQKTAKLIGNTKQLIKNGDYTQAIQTATAILEKDQENGQMLYLRAVAYSKVKNRKKMLADLEAAADLGIEPAKATLNKFKQAA